MNQKDNELLSRFDADPGRWRPMFYGVEVSVPVGANASGNAAVNLNNQPFIWRALRHGVIGQLDYTVDFTGSGLKDDGQYSIEFRDENSNYQNLSIPAITLLGTRDYWKDFPFPIPYNGNRTITFRVTNRYTRTLVPEADYFTVGLLIVGVADWGTLQTSRA